MKNKIHTLKNLFFTFLGMTFLFMSCCPNYCAGSLGHELIPFELFDKNTGEQIISSTVIYITSESGNDSSIERSSNDDLKMNLSLANKGGMRDVITLSRYLHSNEIAKFEVEYELIDNSCCDKRSVNVSKLRNQCTDPDVNIIRVDGKVEKIEISIIP